MAHECAFCGSETMKVIYLGLPGRLCSDWNCALLEGLAAHAPPVVTETEHGPLFKYMVYEGSYWRALWHWLFGRRDE